MNREIKFRAYDKKENKWLFEYEKLGGFSLIGEVALFHGFGEVSLQKLLEDVEIMQYTGLNKNGIEIYEGDEIDTGIHKVKGIVEFDTGCFSLKITHSKSKFIDVGQSIPLFEFETLEVIGNIYQNPELITK